MRKTALMLLAAIALLASCDPFKSGQYPSLFRLDIKAVYPEDCAASKDATVRISNMNNGDSYQIPLSGDGTLSCTLPSGIYDAAVSDVRDDEIFSGVLSRIVLTSDRSLDVKLSRSRAGSIIVKEIYCGGCRKTPQEGNYFVDKYIILHNNHYRTQYLDSLCFGTLHPFNSNATNPWKPEEQNFLPVAQCVWQFGGDGHSFPLEPGEDAVLSITGAIDHASQYPLSVNLNKPGYFVCYNPTYFTNPTYHPAPGDKIALDHYLDVVIKTGEANAYTFSNTSPAVVLFKAKGQTIQEFVVKEGSVIQTPGDSHNPVVALPLDWVVDAVEVYAGSSAANRKRFPAMLDAGAISLSATYLGHTLLRKTDEELSASSGYEVLKDTNNSTEDFVESEKQSLHE